MAVLAKSAKVANFSGTVVDILGILAYIPGTGAPDSGADRGEVMIEVSTKPRKGAKPALEDSLPPIWRPHFEKLSDIQFKETHFLWKPYIPAGALTLLFGYGGMGKSWITCSIAADISAGRPLPGSSKPLPPQKVLMVSAEDDPSRIIQPRMASLDADMDNVFISEEAFVLDQRGVRGLEQVMKDFSATILFLDPIVSYLGGVMDMNKSNETRAMMGPLGEAAKRTGCAVVVVGHSRKGKGGRDIERAIGSADFANSVRSALMVDGDDNGTRVMTHVKHNWSSAGPSLAYRLVDDKFEWMGEPEAETNAISRKPRTKAKDFLQEALHHGPVLMRTVIAWGSLRGLSERTLIRAKDSLAHSRKMPQGWAWELNEREGFGDELVEELPSYEELSISKDADSNVASRSPADPPDVLDNDLLASARAKIEAKRARNG